MSEPQVHDDLVKVAIAAVQLLMVALGWRVVSRENDKREKRKEIRSILNEVRQLLTQVEMRAIEYYRIEPEKSKDLAIQIKQQIKQIATLVTMVTRLSTKFDLSEAMMEFRSAVTGGDFESANRPLRSSDDQLFAQISLTSAELLNLMEEIFSSIYS